MLNHKHYTFRLIDQTPKEDLPKLSPFELGMYLRAYMTYYVAENKLQKEMDGKEQQYINMLAEEFASNGLSSG